MKIIEGTARNMGVAVEGLNDKDLQNNKEIKKYNDFIKENN